MKWRLKARTTGFPTELARVVLRYERMRSSSLASLFMSLALTNERDRGCGGDRHSVRAAPPAAAASLWAGGGGREQGFSLRHTWPRAAPEGWWSMIWVLGRQHRFPCDNQRECSV